MKTPGPDHPISIEPKRQRVRARFVDTAHAIIADSEEAVVLNEASLPPVVYFPRDAVEMGYAARSGTVTHCPYKGDATHYTFTLEGRVLEDAAWSYEDPYPAVGGIAGMIAFYPDRGIEVYEVDEAELADRHAEHRPVV